MSGVQRLHPHRRDRRPWTLLGELSSTGAAEVFDADATFRAGLERVVRGLSAMS